MVSCAMSGVLESSGVEQIAEVIPVVGHKVVFRVENCQLDRCAHIQSYYSSTVPHLQPLSSVSQHRRLSLLPSTPKSEVSESPITNVATEQFYSISWRRVSSVYRPKTAQAKTFVQDQIKEVGGMMPSRKLRRSKTRLDVIGCQAVSPTKELASLTTGTVYLGVIHSSFIPLLRLPTPLSSSLATTVQAIEFCDRTVESE